MNQLLLVSVCSSASKMSTTFTIIMPFPGCFVWKTRRDIPQNPRTLTTGWVKRVRCWPHNRVHPINDSVEGTVEIF